MKVKIEARQKAIKAVRSECSLVVSRFRSEVQKSKKAYKRIKKVKTESFDFFLSTKLCNTRELLYV